MRRIHIDGDILSPAVPVLRQAKGVDFTVSGDKVIFTVPTGFFFIIFRAWDQTEVISGSGPAHKGRWRADATGLGGGGNVQSVSDAVGDITNYMIGNNAVILGGAVLKYELNTPSSFTTHTGRVSVLGALAEV